MTNEQINRMAVEALGIEWLEPKRYLVVYNPDFCNDLNAAQRLLKSITVEFVLAHEGIGFNATLPILLKDNEWYCLTPRQVILTSAKTITLACLVALGKITLEEAEESL